MREIGVTFKNGKCIFNLWAPMIDRVSLEIIYPFHKKFPMHKKEFGYWELELGKLAQGARYFYDLNGKKRPDPASMFQPFGVHGVSQVVDHSRYIWSDKDWLAPDLEEMIIYEMHVGTFTKKGNFQACIPRLKELARLGINAIEIMPVAQFPGKRNWGYDGVDFFSVQNSYGGPDGLKKMIDACHGQGLAVILDVVYNHAGPEGNYLSDYGPYFTDQYRTPWGQAINYDGPYSNEVRNFFIQNALYWLKNFHLDGLRLDAIHGIKDFSAKKFLDELSEEVKKYCGLSGKKHFLIAESDSNDPRTVDAQERGGLGLDAQWLDDFHHSIFTLLSPERSGHLADYGRLAQLSTAYRNGFVFSGQYSFFRKRNHGSSSSKIPARKFIVFNQNHDQIGNRIFGERLSTLFSFEALKLCAAAVMLSPYIPLLFMGEEYAEDNPFVFFTDYSQKKLISSVSQGRKNEFKDFNWQAEPPVHFSKKVFKRCVLSWEKRYKGKNKIMLKFYKKIILLRKTSLLRYPDKIKLKVTEGPGKILILKRWNMKEKIYCLMNFAKEEAAIKPNISGRYVKLLDSSEKLWMGPGSFLPDKLKRNSPLVVPGFTFCLYREKL